MEKKRLYLVIARLDKDEWSDCWKRAQAQGLGWAALVSELGDSMPAFTENDGSIVAWMLHTTLDATTITKRMKADAPMGRGSLSRLHDKFAAFEIMGDRKLDGFTTVETFIGRRAPALR